MNTALLLAVAVVGAVLILGCVGAMIVVVIYQQRFLQSMLESQRKLGAEYADRFMLFAEARAGLSAAEIQENLRNQAFYRDMAGKSETPAASPGAPVQQAAPQYVDGDVEDVVTQMFNEAAEQDPASFGVNPMEMPRGS